METMVGMGQIVFGQAPDRLASILGSCIGVSLYHPRMRHAALAHIILPDSQGRTPSSPGKFADTAIPHMLKLLGNAGLTASSLVAKLAGGANMFGHTGPLQIGMANGAAVSKALAGAGIRVVGEDLGGDRGRRISLDCVTGDLLIEIAGADVRMI